MRIIGCILLILLLAPTRFVRAQTVEWDLTYEKVLHLNGVKWDHSQGTLFTWLKHRQDEHKFITRFINMELEKHPEEMFVIDHPTFPSAGRITIIGVKNAATLAQVGCGLF